MNGDSKEEKYDTEVLTTEEFEIIPNCESMKPFLNLLHLGKNATLVRMNEKNTILK